jgi:hypothetical protein
LGIAEDGIDRLSSPVKNKNIFYLSGIDRLFERALYNGIDRDSFGDSSENLEDSRLVTLF